MSKKTVKHKQYYNFFYKILQEKRTVIKQSFQAVDKAPSCEGAFLVS